MTEAHRASRTRGVFPGHVCGGRAAGPCVGAIQSGRAVSTEPGAGSRGPAAAHPRDRAGASALWVHAHLGGAPT